MAAVAIIYQSIVYQSSSQTLKLPSKLQSSWLVLLVLLVLLALISALWSIAPYTAVLHGLFILSAIVLYISMLQLSESQQSLIFSVVIAAALIQLPILVLQKSGLDAWLPQVLCCDSKRASALTGSREFLAFMIMAAIFLLRHLRAECSRWYWPLTIALVAGLIVLRNKSAILFLLLTLAWVYFPVAKNNIRWKTITLVLIGTILLTVLVVFFPDSMKGRLLLWAVAISMFVNNWQGGVGLRQFGDHYLGYLHQMFQDYPNLSETLGEYSANTLDAHNLPLHMAAELGVFGLLIALIFLITMFTACRRHGGALAVFGFFIIYKSLFTVVMNSVSGMLISIILLAAINRGHAVSRKIRFPGLMLGTVALYGVLLFYMGKVIFADIYYQQGLKATLLSDVSAKSSFTQALQAKPDFAEAYLSLAFLAARDINVKEVKKQLELSLRYGADVNKIKIAAHIYMRIGEDNKALMHYLYIHQAYPQQLTPLVNMARIYLRQARYQQAMFYANKALLIDPRIKSSSYSRNKAIANDIVRRLEHTENEGESDSRI